MVSKSLFTTYCISDESKLLFDFNRIENKREKTKRFSGMCCLISLFIVIRQQIKL